MSCFFRRYKVNRWDKWDRWICKTCDYIYDPCAGDPEQNIEPGRAFRDLPADWVCPDCGAGKSGFGACNVYTEEIY
jgi:rubredoxin